MVGIIPITFPRGTRAPTIREWHGSPHTPWQAGVLLSTQHTRTCHINSPCNTWRHYVAVYLSAEVEAR